MAELAWAAPVAELALVAAVAEMALVALVAELALITVTPLYNAPRYNAISGITR